jgi:hypothetical protein
MNKLTSLALAGMLSMACGLGVAQAQGTPPKPVSLPHFRMPIATFHALAKSQRVIFGVQRGNIVRPDSPAPPLTEMAIIAVCEGNTFCDDISADSTITGDVFTGTDVQPLVLEIGDGDNQIASQGGSQLPLSDLLAQDLVCEIGDELETGSACDGLPSVGFLLDWEVGPLLSEGFGENFAAQATSINPPINTLSVGIEIQYEGAE